MLFDKNTFIYTKTFEVDKIEYNFYLTKDNRVSFIAEKGTLNNGTRLGSYDGFGDKITSIELTDSCSHPLTVFTKAGECLVEALNITKIPYFTFNAIGRRRIEVYKKLIDKIEELTGYVFQDVGTKFIGYFMFIKSI